MYNSDFVTFFIPIGELGYTLHKMFEVSLLSIRKLPYEEFVLTTEELNLLRTHNVRVYEKTYRE